MKQILICACLLITTLSTKAQELPNFRLNLTGGYSYFTATDPNDAGSEMFINNDTFKKYNRDLQWGLNAEGNAHYLLKNGLGFGAKYRYMKTDVSETDLLFDAGDAHYGVVNVSEENKIMFIAPSLMYALWLEPTRKFLGSGALSVGYAYLESSGTVDNESAMFSSSNGGFQIDLGVDYFLTRNISVGLSTGYFYAKIKEVNINLSENKTKLPENVQPNLSSLKLNLSLSSNF
ncbi:MAG: outer membrane beta-barrel protein [Proteiniphilum sp.]